MAFTESITLTKADASSQVYSTVSKNDKRTIRRDATRGLDQPMSLTVSHEEINGGKRVNTAVIIDRTDLDDDLVTLGNLRVLCKVTYDKEVISAASIDEALDELKEFLTAANITKLLNQEH